MRESLIFFSFLGQRRDCQCRPGAGLSALQPSVHIAHRSIYRSIEAGILPRASTVQGVLAKSRSGRLFISLFSRGQIRNER
ncbi:uncharacterized protein EI90DRAFT_3054455 [Cantharellus anzutake]|uniref:uncharacterized protein n=1 Tax=Cantharellus anzutake TaxID=1750568 RepID=UPI001905E5FB|nr:uncharacterized protein EI90DRAFT_3054455 [Cantharellus anzutake]KAF8332797.1 hypothetical protein EI90DRAFT_3054455 [Cantharellus anzutake]